jgi:hypothetical protein
MSGRKSLAIGPFLSMELLCGLSRFIMILAQLETGGGIRGKYRILDEKARIWYGS